MSILDNQEVNADILNGIAKDLGATEFSEFVDGEKFGADKLNAITAALVTSGVISNDGESCKVTIADRMISVGTGTIVFESGAKMKITENQTLELVENTKTYVVAVNDTTNNRMLLYNLEAEPTEDDYALLAEVLATGEVLDKRAWATAKFDGIGGPVYEHIQVCDDMVLNTNHTYTLSKVIKLTRSGYHAMVIDGYYQETYKIFISLDGSPIDVHFTPKGQSSVFIHLIYDGQSTVEIYSTLSSGYYFNSNPASVTRTVTFGLFFF